MVASIGDGQGQKARLSAACLFPFSPTTDQPDLKSARSTSHHPTRIPYSRPKLGMNRREPSSPRRRSSLSLASFEAA